MGASVDYLHRDPKTGRLSFRRGIPTTLRPFFPGQPREFKRSVASKSIHDPKAAQLFAEAAAEYDRLTALARKSAAGAFDPLDDARIAWIAKTFEAQILSKDERLRMLGKAVPQEQHEAASDGLREIFAESDPNRVRGFYGEFATSIAAQQAWRLDETSEEFTRLCFALLTVAIEANDIKLARDEGHPVATPSQPEPLSPSGSQVSHAIGGLSFQSVAETILSTARLEIGAATAQATRTALRYFREAFGDTLKPSQITRRHVAEWLDLMSKRPRIIRANERKLGIKDLVTLYADRPDVPRLKGKTIAQNLTSLSAIWNKGRQEGLIEQGIPNPFRDHIVKVAPRPEIPQELSGGESWLFDRLGIKNVISIPTPVCLSCLPLVSLV